MAVNYAQHARALARLNGVTICETTDMRPEEAHADPRDRSVRCVHIIDETTYAVVLHEMGHLCAPGAANIDDINTVLSSGGGRLAWQLLRAQEEAAWTWAEKNAVEWTPVMQSVKNFALTTYTHMVVPCRRCGQLNKVPRTVHTARCGRCKHLHTITHERPPDE